MKTVYVYNIRLDWKFWRDNENSLSDKREYICVANYQSNPVLQNSSSIIFVGELEIEDQSTTVDFGNIIYKDVNILKLVDKELFFENYPYDENSDTEDLNTQNANGKDLNRKGAKEEDPIKKGKILKRDGSTLSYCTDGQFVYNYVENLPIKDEIFSYEELLKACEKNELLILDRMILKISFDASTTLRNGGSMGTIFEYYIKSLNVSINYGRSDVNIILNPEGRYELENPGEFTNLIDRPFKIGEVSLDFEESETINNFVKLHALKQTNRNSVIGIMECASKIKIQNPNYEYLYHPDFNYGFNYDELAIPNFVKKVAVKNYLRNMGYNGEKYEFSDSVKVFLDRFLFFYNTLEGFKERVSAWHLLFREIDSYYTKNKKDFEYIGVFETLDEINHLNIKNPIIIKINS